jgi:hypothetical protein
LEKAIEVNGLIRRANYPYPIFPAAYQSDTIKKQVLDQGIACFLFVFLGQRRICGRISGNKIV